MMISQMNQSQLLHWIDMVSFAVVEITEYLDTHPACICAKLYSAYHRHRKS